MDAVNLIEPYHWARFNQDIKNYAGRDFFILGEIWDISPFIFNQYTPYFDAAYDFSFFYAMQREFIWGRPRQISAFSFQGPISLANRALILAPFVDNHDTSRYATVAGKYSRAAPERAPLRAHQAQISLLTTPGLPYLLYGTEIGLEDDPAMLDSIYDRGRSKMIFANNNDHVTFKFIKRLIALRKKYRLGRRRISVVPTEPFLFAYELIAADEKEKILVLHNVSHLRLPASHKLITPGLVARDLLTGEKFAEEVPVMPDHSRILLIEDSQS